MNGRDIVNAAIVADIYIGVATAKLRGVACGSVRNIKISKTPNE